MIGEYEYVHVMQCSGILPHVKHRMKLSCVMNTPYMSSDECGARYADREKINIGMQTRSVNHLAAVLVIIDLARLSPGINRIHVTALNGRIPHEKTAYGSFFGRFAQEILGVMSNSDVVDVAIITIPPIDQWNVSMTQYELTNQIKAMICNNQNYFSTSFIVNSMKECEVMLTSMKLDVFGSVIHEPSICLKSFANSVQTMDLMIDFQSVSDITRIVI